MTGASVLRMRGYRPVSKAAEINCPVLLIAPEADDICLFEGAALVASNASSNAELLKTEGPYVQYIQLNISHHRDRWSLGCLP